MCSTLSQLPPAGFQCPKNETICVENTFVDTDHRSEKKLQVGHLILPSLRVNSTLPSTWANLQQNWTQWRGGEWQRWLICQATKCFLFLRIFSHAFSVFSLSYQMGEDSAEYRAFIQQPSANMDDSGFFSVQVFWASINQLEWLRKKTWVRS